MIDYLERRAKGEALGGLSLQVIEEQPKEGSKNENSAKSKKDEPELAGKKRLRLDAFNAVTKGEIVNSVEFAFL